MVTIMDMTTGVRLTENDRYGDEVLNANWMMPQAALLALGLQTVETVRTHIAAPLVDPETFLQRLYSAQE